MQKVLDVTMLHTEIGRASSIGGQAPLMSPEIGLSANSSSFTSLRLSPDARGQHHRGSPVARPGGDGSGRWGVLRSEVKEEESAGRSIPGDMNGAVRPAGLIPLGLGARTTEQSR